MADQSTLNILAVEDDESNRFLLAEIMMLFGHNLELAITGTQGIQYLQTSNYDAVLTDCQLSDIHGDRVAEAAKEKHPDVPVIMVTASNVSTAPDKYPPNVDRVVAKPYDVKELDAVITAAVNERRT